jgi:bacterioferritin
MKGSEKVLSQLNDRLADELTAINQYMVHAALCNNWGYEKLHKAAEMRAREEMKHAEALIDRILLLEGMPVVSKLNKIIIGSTVQDQHANDHKLEQTAVIAYNESIAIAVSAGDNGSRELFENNLEDEESHIDYLEAQLAQIRQMGIQNYLSEQV